MTFSKKYKVKKIDPVNLRESKGKIATEELFLRDARLTKMFLKYMTKNISYLKKYEHDKQVYDSIEQQLLDMTQSLKTINETFKEYQKNSIDD